MGISTHSEHVSAMQPVVRTVLYMPGSMQAVGVRCKLDCAASMYVCAGYEAA